uniref:TNFR-Cys domain-containing protein n=1 Tax=Astatotilapia calliptera TaxID=8154 RepID=A0AAX7UZ34_ASTCA
ILTIFLLHSSALIFRLLCISFHIFLLFHLLLLSVSSQFEAFCRSFIITGNRVKTDCTETAHTSCVACEGGTHMDKPSGLKQCTHCTICDLSFGLKENRTCTSTLDTVCKPEDGFYCVDVAAGSCMAAHKHRQCQPGEYISQTGTAFRDTECSDCSNGTFSDGTLKFCRPHRPCESLNLKLIRPGNATTDAQCEEQDQDNVVPIIIGCLLTILVIGIVIVIVIYVKRKTLWGKQKNGTIFLSQRSNSWSPQFPNLYGLLFKEDQLRVLDYIRRSLLILRN